MQGLVFPAKEFRCSSKEIGMQPLEQRTDLIWLIVQKHHINRWWWWWGVVGRGREGLLKSEDEDRQ